jgi:hypothetical protein
MSSTSTAERLALKTPEAAFLNVLEREFHFSPRVAGEVLNAARETLDGTPTGIRPGQVRLVVARLDAPFGPPLADSAKLEVTLTVDVGREDITVATQEGREGLRRGRILRVLAEAVEQGGVLTQEDLARVLSVDVRTIRRDIQQLKAEAHTIDTRGPVKGVGRGQTHKVKIIALWLDRQGYDKIARWVHHSPQAIKRYVTTFLRMVLLHQQGRAVSDIAFMTGSSERLVQDYLALYEVAQATPTQRAKLEEELVRVSAWQGERTTAAEKGGPTP